MIRILIIVYFMINTDNGARPVGAELKAEVRASGTVEEELELELTGLVLGVSTLAAAQS